MDEMQRLADELQAKLREYPFLPPHVLGPQKTAEFNAIGKVREAVLNVIAMRSQANPEAK